MLLLYMESCLLQIAINLGNCVGLYVFVIQILYLIVCILQINNIGPVWNIYFPPYFRYCKCMYIFLYHFIGFCQVQNYCGNLARFNFLKGCFSMYIFLYHFIGFWQVRNYCGNLARFNFLKRLFFH